MTTHNHGRVSPFGHPRINAHQATPRGLTQPITSFIGLAYPGIHHAPKKQKTQTFFTHRQQKIPRTKPQKRKNKQQPFIVVFLSHSRPLYSSHTTHHPTHNTQQKALPTRGDLQNNTRAALDTQQHATNKTNHQTKPEHKHTCYSAKTFTTNKAERPQKILVSSTPKTTHMKYVRYLSSPENKNLPPHAKPTCGDKKLSPARC